MNAFYNDSLSANEMLRHNTSLALLVRAGPLLPKHKIMIIVSIINIIIIINIHHYAPLFRQVLTSKLTHTFISFLCFGSISYSNLFYILTYI